MKKLRIGLLIHEFDSSFSHDFLSGAFSWCQENGLDLIVFSVRSPGWPYGWEYQHLTTYRCIKPHSVDALIVLTGTQCNYITVDEYRAWLTALSPLPMVSLSIAMPDIPSVLVDNDKGLAALVDHVLHVHGRTSPLIIRGPDDHPESNRRMAMIKGRLGQNGIHSGPHRELVGAFSTSVSTRAMEAFLANEHPAFDCVFALSDMMAIGAIRALASAGYRVPEDIIVTGFDNIKNASFFTPTLSTVNQDIYTQSRIAASWAHRLALGEDVPASITLPALPLFRQSCGCVGKMESKINALDEEGHSIPWASGLSGNPGFERFRIEDDVFRLRRYIAHLNTVFTLSELLQTLRSDLEAFKIKSAAVILYDHGIIHRKEDPFELPSRANLLLGYDEDTPAGREADGHIFNPRERLYPEGTFGPRPRKLVVTSLFHKEELLGYMVFEPGIMSTAIYETVCVQLSHIISSDLLYMENLFIEENLMAVREHLEANNRELDSIARIDELTGLYNRRGFMNLGQQAIQMYVKLGKEGLVILGDMDGLKTINDTWGHDAGDRAIMAVSTLLRKAFRNLDIIARLSGDEFAIVAVDMTVQAFSAIRERFTALADEWNKTSGHPFTLSMSFGAELFSAQCPLLETLLSCADARLYEEKRMKKEGAGEASK